MRASIVIAGVIAAVFAGALALFTVGTVPAVVVVLLIIGAIVLGFFLPENALRGLTTLFVVLTVASLAVGAWGAWSIARALSDTSGDVDPADPAALASVDAKLAAAEDEQGFRVEFTMEELNAAVQDALAGGDHPVRAVAFSVVRPDLAGERGILGFEASFKSGSTSASGELQVELEAGRPALTVRDLDFGIFTLPGVAEDAASDLVDTVADLNDALADLDAELQDVRIYPDSVGLLGVQRGATVTPDRVLDRIRSTAGSLDIDVQLPDPEYEPGVDSNSVDGTPYYVALGDSLAANVGVGRAGRGYVSMFHRYLTERDGIDYGMRNFGISGETSSSILDGQLDEAVTFMESNDVAFVTIDIGANDFLGHLSSGDCASDIESPACLERLDATYLRYRVNLAEILDTLAAAAPDATIVFLTSYNPFSFGLQSEVDFERLSNQVTERFNAIAIQAALEREMLVADGFGAIVARAIVLTRMLDDPADIHPTQAGYDRLTDALVDALEGRP